MKGGVMQLNACGIHFRLTPAIERHVRERVNIAIHASEGSISDVSVRLRDTNGPRGGVDKACRIVAWLRHRATVVVEAVHGDLYAAIDAAAAKLKEAVRRRTKRRRTLHREFAARHQPRRGPRTDSQAE
jgi:ribosomal subunit interface protein